MAYEDGALKPELKPLIIAMNNLLADLFAEYHSLKQRHWHLKGIVFRDVHEFFDAVTDEILEWIDDAGEYVVSFGGIAVTSLDDVRSKANIPVADPTERNPLDLLRNGLEAIRYLKRFYTQINDIAENANELGVENLCADTIQEIDKFIYKYQAYLDLPK